MTALIMWEQYLINSTKRKLSKEEIILVCSLYDTAQIKKPKLSEVQVQKINHSTGTIRSSLIDDGERTHAVSSCAFYDDDGFYVEVILFLHSFNQFGELYIWKVTDTPVIKLPSKIDCLIDFQKI